VRSCETITQPPEPFHVTPRALPGRTCWHDDLSRSRAAQPLNRQSERVMPARGIDLRVSTMAE